MNFGLSIDSTSILKSIFSEYVDVEKVVIYGSRAKGNFNKRSDVDLVIAGDIDRHVLGDINLTISNSDFPLPVDLQSLDSIKNESLLEHIARVGQVFYQNRQNDPDKLI
jgi:predicted nucleotidyltransferase